MGKPDRKIKKPKAKSSGNIVAPPDSLLSSNSQSPIFSFRHVIKDYCACQCIPQDHPKVWSKIETVSTTTWDVIQRSDRFGLGTEIISSIKKTRPEVVPDGANILAFHTTGKTRIIGYRDGRMFYVLWVDCTGDVYEH